METEKGYEGMVNRGNDTESEKRKLPRNIRQIGEAGNGNRVYLEDYAVTYLRQVKAAVLLGEIRQNEGSTCYFVNGALEVEDPAFPEETWEQIYREAKEYFEGRDVIGWFIRTMGGTWKVTEEMEQVYRQHFEKEQPVLILYDEDEEEEGIYLAENGVLTRQRGYYIYYEKNQLMQDYMVWRNSGKSVEKEAQVSDSAIRNFRKIIESKTAGTKGRTKEKAFSSRLVYSAGAFLVLTLFAIGITMIQNYDKMKEVEQTVENMAQTASEAAAPSIQVSAEIREETEETEGENGLDVQVISMPEDTQLEARADADTSGENGILNEAAEQSDTTDQGSAADQRNVADQDSTVGQSSTAEQNAAEAQGNAAGDAGTGDQDGMMNQSGTAGQNSTGSQSGTEEAISHSMRAEYVVKEGDTLADVCEMYYGSLDMIDQICQANNIENPNQILPGQKIVLP
ncbi:MAG: LysM peptidoglycan-binding domain-containing protein [Candidatus Limivivens sp.]|nr:LysM peptidoglycan-binding domain-containing protein [Candidatus Limivivens sp.]